jgi:predicted ATPase
MRHIAISLLGPFAVTIDGVLVTTFAYTKVRALLAYLAVEADRPHSRAQLATLLWPDQPEQAARGSLSQALTTLRNALGDKTAERPLLRSDSQSVQLDPDSAIEVDVTQFLDLLRSSESHAHHSWRTCALCTERLQQAIGLYRSHFLADFSISDSEVFEEWAALRREHLLQRALSALERLAERAQWRGAYSEAMAYAQRQVAIEPLLEDKQRTLMQLLALNGERAAAVAQYKQLQNVLAQELDAKPEEATTALFDQIRQGDMASVQPSQIPFVVPAPPTPLVNRTEKQRAICACLQHTSARAVTIAGPGGVGKTRLAIEVAHTLRYDFEDGVYFVDLTPLNDAGLVADAIARVLGVKERSRQSIGETLRDHLRAKHLLLVLDNFEHVLEAASLVSQLLAGCPTLTVLVTSREPLNIRAEHLFALEPLAAADAVQLFAQRVQAVGVGWAADAANAAVYAAICARLDGLPLAIELIAARARTLSPNELLQQLDRPLHALVRGPRDLPTRHQSLRNAIQWSYDLLDGEQQRVFMALGVFAGGCTAEAAQAVLGRSSEVLPALEALYQASLLRQHADANQTRFSMLETIREFALEQLKSSGEAATAQRFHAEYYARFSMLAYVELLCAEASTWRARIAAEQDNLRAAFRWALEHQAYETALRIATGTWRFHWMCGSLREGLERLEAALAYCDRAPWEVQSNAMRAAGVLAIGLNDYARARQWLEAAVVAGRRMDDQQKVQAALTNLGFALLEQGELEVAQAYLEESLELARRSEDARVAKFPLSILSGLHVRLGQYAEARTLCEQSLHLNRVYQDPEGIANCLRTMALILNRLGDRSGARRMVDEALALHRSLDHQLGMGLDYAVFGDIAREQADEVEALEYYRRCLNLWQDRENMVNSALVLDSVARSLGRMGDPARAVTLMAAAAAIRERANAKLAANEQAECDETARACQAALDDAAFAAAWAAGRALTLAQAIGLALE